MKKVIALLITALTVFAAALCGCNGGDGGASPPEPDVVQERRNDGFDENIPKNDLRDIKELPDIGFREPHGRRKNLPPPLPPIPVTPKN